MDYTLIINNLSAHGGIKKEEIESFTSLLEEVEISKKDFLLRTGETCRYDYFVNKGCLKVCFTDDKGVECIIKFAPENWWVTDLESFLYGIPSFYYIQAVEPTQAFRLSKSAYDRLQTTLTAFQQFSSIRWQQGFIALQHRLIQSLSMTAEERYEAFVKKYPGLEQRLSQKLIAAYLGITPEFLSMLRKKWSGSFS